MTRGPKRKSQKRINYLNEDLYGPLLRWRGVTLPEVMFVMVLVFTAAVFTLRKIGLIH